MRISAAEAGPAQPGRAHGGCVTQSKMEWLIGSSEVDLSPAERAINQLAGDRDSVAGKLKELQDEAAAQQ